MRNCALFASRIPLDTQSSSSPRLVSPEKLAGTLFALFDRLCLVVAIFADFQVSISEGGRLSIFVFETLSLTKLISVGLALFVSRKVLVLSLLLTLTKLSFL